MQKHAQTSRHNTRVASEHLRWHCTRFRFTCRLRVMIKGSVAMKAKIGLAVIRFLQLKTSRIISLVQHDILPSFKFELDAARQRQVIAGSASQWRVSTIVPTDALGILQYTNWQALTSTMYMYLIVLTLSCTTYKIKQCSLQKSMCVCRLKASVVYYQADYPMFSNHLQLGGQNTQLAPFALSTIHNKACLLGSCYHWPKIFKKNYMSCSRR